MKKKLIELQKRIGELDTISQRIYEDNIIGKLSDERFMKMSKGYEEEQRTLQAEADKIQNELQQEEKCRCETLSCHHKEIHGPDRTDAGNPPGVCGQGYRPCAR